MGKCIMKAMRCGRTWGMAADGAQEARVYVMGAKTQEMPRVVLPQLILEANLKPKLSRCLVKW